MSNPSHSLSTKPSPSTSEVTHEKMDQPKTPNRKRFWTKVTLITLAILIPIIILVACLATLLPRKHSQSNSGSSSSSPSSDDQAVAHLDYGSYQGTRLAASGVDQYMGVRFAAPPTGNNRWRAPQPPLKFNGTQNATIAQPVCLGVGATPDPSSSEDCLFANIFTPSNATSKSKLPVWVYVQGGGYAGDSNANYNGTQVVQTGNIVLVNFNYRVGSWGFLASEKVRSNGDLNAGLLDQRAALNWTRNYIEQFGGDPNHIVVHGGSAGAGSVAHHLTAYGGRNDNLFVGAITQSPFYQTEMTVAELEWQFNLFTADTNCNGTSDVMACLRSTNLTILQNADFTSPFPGHQTKPRHSWGPCVDGDLVPDFPISLFNQGKFISVPLLVGDEPDEGTLFVPNATTSADVRTFFNVNYPRLNTTQLDSIITQYPTGVPRPQHAAWFGTAAQAYGESSLICPGIWMCEAMSKKNSSGVWNYSFNVSAATDWNDGLGAFHTIDTSAIFGPDYAGVPTDPSTKSFATTNSDVVPILMDYYLSFVKTLSPNTLKNGTAPVFENFGQGGGQNRLRIELDDYEMENVPSALLDNCKFWSGLQVSMEL